MFTWSTQFGRMYIGDFDGDGITDYITGDQDIYKGIANGEPPLQPNIAKFTVPHNRTYSGFVGDFDGDGKSDLLIRALSRPGNEPYLGSLVMGNSDLKQMDVLAMQRTDNTVIECIVDAYTTAEGKARMVTIELHQTSKTAYCIVWALLISPDGLGRKVEYKPLSYYETTYSDVSGITDQIGELYDSQSKERTLLWDDKVLSLDNDDIKLLYTSPIMGYPQCIVRNKTTRDSLQWVGAWSYKDDSGATQILMTVLQGSPREEHDPVARYPFRITSDDGIVMLLDNQTGIGDVNGDGAEDIAAYYYGESQDGSGRSRIVFYLGVGGATGVEEQHGNVGGLQLTLSPQPIEAERLLRVNLSAATKIAPASLELYDLQGRRIAQLWQGNLTPEPQQIELSLKPYALGTGFYNLRLNSGEQHCDKGILIGER